MTIVVCFSEFSENKIKQIECPTCKHLTNFLCRFQEWYGWSTVCLECGDHWEDGELSERPFARGWRKESVAAAIATAEKLGLWPITEPQSCVS